LQRGCHTFATFFATCNTYSNKQDGGRVSRWHLAKDWPILTKLRCKLQRGCYTQANCLETLQKVEGRSTFLATRNATIAVAKWGVITREFFFATWFVALQVARKIASCNMALRLSWAITTEVGGFIPQNLMLRSIVLGWILIHWNWSVAAYLFPVSCISGQSADKGWNPWKIQCFCWK